MTRLSITKLLHGQTDFTSDIKIFEKYFMFEVLYSLDNTE